MTVKRFFCSTTGWLFFLLLSFSVSGATGLPAPETLKRALISRGVPKQVVHSYLRGSKGAVNLDIILKNISHREKKGDYSHFLEKKRVGHARQFLARYKAFFVGVERSYGVPKEVIASILMVESSFGKGHERYSVFEVYTSLASLLDRKVRKAVRRKALKAGIKVNAPAFEKRINRKAAWGLRQLVCLIRLSRQKKIDLLNLKGSWAGAFGMPQFIPSSFEKYGIDWEKDGKVNLNKLPDAAASAANYLRAHGWKKKMNHARALKVIKRYNHSQPYADTILEISKQLKKNDGAFKPPL